MLALAAAAAMVVGATGGAAKAPWKVHAAPTTPIQAWLTDVNANTRLQQQPALTSPTWHSGTSPEPLTVTFDVTQTYQSMVGFGASFTDSSAWLVHDRLSATERDGLMNKLFDPASGIGLTMLRQPIGGSDFTVAGPYTYDDVVCCNNDYGLAGFSISHDEPYVLPLLREARAISPGLTTIATPWSPPAWMRQFRQLVGAGGPLRADSYNDWAQYFVKYLQAYQAAGVPIAYISPQNEPAFAPTTYPGMVMTADEQSMLIKTYLGPALAAANVNTKILGWEHNWDTPSYPETLLADPVTSQYVAGTSWHCYGGTPDAETVVHDLYPTKDNFTTECTGLFTDLNEYAAFQGDMRLILGSTRNWARGVTMWNMALDQVGGPSQGCLDCQGVVTISLGTDGAFHWTPTSDYYALGQFSKFVRPGATRVSSNSGQNGLTDVAFVNTDGSRVVVAYNDGSAPQQFAVQVGTAWFDYTLNPGAAVSFVF